MTDEFYMQLSLNKAWEFQGLTYPNPAVGAVVVCGGEILAIEAHQKAGSSHAEVLHFLKLMKNFLIQNLILIFKILKKHTLFYSLFL